MNPVLLADLYPKDVTLIALAAIVGVFVVSYLFRKDDKIEERRKDAIEVSQVLSNWGFKRLPRFITNYAVGDYSGMVYELKSFAKDYANEAQLELELEGVFSRILEAKAKDSDKRAALYDRLAKLQVTYPLPQPPAPPAPPAAPPAAAPAAKAA